MKCQNPTCDRPVTRGIHDYRSTYCSPACRRTGRNPDGTAEIRIRVPMTLYHQLEELAEDYGLPTLEALVFDLLEDEVR